MTATAAVHTWVVYVGFASVGFAFVVVVLALVAWVARAVERRHQRRHGRRREQGYPFGTTAAGRWER